MNLQLTTTEKLDIDLQAIKDALEFLECKDIQERTEFVRMLSNRLRGELKSTENRLTSIITEKTL